MEFKFEWDYEYADIGSYGCELTLKDGYRLHIGVHDNTCAFQQGQRAKNPVVFDHYHPFDYEVDFCHGYSMHRGFNKPMTLEEVMTWAEDYLLDGLITNYEQTLAELDELKARAEWAKQYKENRRKS